MTNTFFMIANCVAIVASISGFGITLYHLWKGVPASNQERRTQVKKAIMVATSFAILLILSSLGLKSNIETYEQSGSFRNYQLGEIQIYYPIPYKVQPKLEFEKIGTTAGNTDGPKIIEQQRNGFKVVLDLDSWAYNWKTVGITIDKE